MKGIYLASYKAYHPNYNIDYQDINGERDISGDMMDIDLSHYDFIIATPPCNWSNIKFKYDDIIQKPIVEIRNGKRIYLSSQNIPNNQRQGTKEVHEVIERFLQTINYETD